MKRAVWLVCVLIAGSLMAATHAAATEFGAMFAEKAPAGLQEPQTETAQDVLITPEMLEAIAPAAGDEQSAVPDASAEPQNSNQADKGVATPTPSE